MPGGDFVFSSILRWLRTPYPFYLNDERKNLWLCVGIGFFIMFFLSVYKSEKNYILFGTVTVIILIFNMIVLARLFPKPLDPTRWTIGKYILLTLWHLISIGIVSTLINIFYVHAECTVMENMSRAFANVATTGVITIALVSLFLRNYQLRENLANALAANQELQKIDSLRLQKEFPSKVTPPEKQMTTLQTETSETFSFSLPDLIYIEADDNYSTIVWRNGHGVERKLLRVNLKSIENQINNSFTIRCHRSFIVNINAISNIIGNTNGYKLVMADLDVTIPVSRPKGKEVIDRIQQWRSMMELS
jgi:LytTr DNA-binding domain